MDRSRRHQPNRLQNYLQIHETVLGQLQARGAVEEDGSEYGPGAGGKFYIVGDILLRERKLKLAVTKALEIVDASDPTDPLIQTVSYSYNISIVGRGNVFRYCSPHDSDGPEHHEQHHRHQYDPFGPNPHRYEVILITDGDWPVLGEVIDEADRWYWDNSERLDVLLKGPSVPERLRKEAPLPRSQLGGRWALYE